QPGPYASNTVVTLTATPAKNWDFLRWTGDVTGTSPTSTVTMDREKSIQAEFSQLALAVTIVGNGSVSMSPPGGAYASNTMVTLMANAGPGWIFDGWSGDATSTDLSINLTMDHDKQLPAQFVPIYSVSVSTPGGGTFTTASQSWPFRSNSVVTVTATP